MAGKYFMIIIFMCACAAAVRAGHARHLRPMEGAHRHPNSKNKPMPTGIDYGSDYSAVDGTKRDDETNPKTPNTVLSVQYDKGFIKELYLTQGVGGTNDIPAWNPSVTEKTQICEDLCQSGLGGDPCGYSCSDRVPYSIKNDSGYGAKKFRPTTKAASNESDSEERYSVGNPRTDVCPAICEYGLGKPLCGCTQNTFPQDIPWTTVCNSFCSSTTGSYQVQGCPECAENVSEADVIELKSSGSSELWIQYCREQCRTGNGGAACNCDKIPFYLQP